jgi:thiol:disulfide interchange protein
MFSLAFTFTKSLLSVVILLSPWWITTALSHHVLCMALWSIAYRAVHRMQWDKAEVIHKEENRITAEMEELLMLTT